MTNFAKPRYMKFRHFPVLLMLTLPGFTQTTSYPQHLFIITTDGFRWQEVFTGADSLLVSDPRFVQDTALLKQQYWDSSPQVRRRLLMPFFWNVIARQGQLYGNRYYGNKANAANLYKISYPGYNEILTGYPDPSIVINLPRENENTNILEFLDKQAGYHGQVVAFSSWYLFPYILNQRRSDLPVNSGYQHPLLATQDSSFQTIRETEALMPQPSHTRNDWLTYLNARQYIALHHPSIVFISLGETDEFAHQGHYDQYLQQASAVDKMVGDLWYLVQTDPYYRDKTSFIITTDHGRGSQPFSWNHHSLFTAGSGQTWMAMLGPGITPIGEIRTPGQIYQKQIASTIAQLLGQDFKTNHRTGKPIDLPKPVSSSTAMAGK